MESRSILEHELNVIKEWEKDQGKVWFWERLSRLPFAFLDKLTPAFIQKKIANLLDEMGSFVQNGGRYLTKEKTVFRLIEKKTGNPITGYEDIQDLPLLLMKEMACELGEQRKRTASIQGAATGVGGLFTLVLDIPAILAIGLKTLQEIAIFHGYDPKDKRERVFMLKCLQFTAADVVGKQAILKELADYDNRSNPSKDVMSQLQGWREVTLTFTEQFGWKKLFQLVPIAGILFGAFANRSMVGDLVETATMLYQKRRISERLTRATIK
ncbi:EcsC family protein [Jeotgalibacillus proteolyticus]|uniref:EcsC family protein n=1 Tax=Jeotgalibacillus proteolyticus TaxID=2082395 RepID=UPI003CF6BEC7